MQHALSLRGMYDAALAPKPKNVATVSPVIEDGDHEDDDLEIPPEPHDDSEADVQLQTKSSLRPSGSSSTLRFPFVGRNSNQEDTDGTSASAGKYAVVGQKQQWRRTRAQRSAATIRHVSEDELDGNGETRDELGERASSYLSTARSERPDVPALAWASTTPVASARSSGRSSSLDYSARSGSSSGRQSSLSDEGTPRELFSVTRQKKSRFSAKLCMPGQNPLYLGRYRSEEAARAACEEAFATITTPRK